jgi:hypothetical protein
MAKQQKQTDDSESPKKETQEFERQRAKGYGQQPFDEQQLEPQEDSGSGSFSEGGARGNSAGH